MITQYEVPGYLEQQLPAFASQPRLVAVDMNIYMEVQHLADYTRQAIEQHNYPLVKRCFRLADNLYRLGDNIVRNAVENIFIIIINRLYNFIAYGKAKSKSGNFL